MAKPAALSEPTFIPTSSINYPFSKNVDLTKSEYTYIENAKLFGAEKVNYGVINQEMGHTETVVGHNYHTSTVVPFVPGQTTFGTGVATGFGESHNRQVISGGGQSDLLRKID